MIVRFAGINDNRGSALMAVLIVVAALLFVSAALLDLSLNEQKIAAHQEKEISLYYLAEAGVEAGIAALKEDYMFQGPLTGLLNQGSYRVRFAPLPRNRRLVISTASRQGKSFDLSVVAGLNPAYEQGLLVSRHLKIENVDICGSCHVNNDLHIGGSNRVRGADFEESVFSHSGVLPRFTEPEAELLIGGRLYTSAAQFNDPALIIDPLVLPSLDLDLLEKKICCFIENSSPDVILNALSGSYPGEDRIQVNGNLLIAPEEGQIFDFKGLLVVRGNLEISTYQGGGVNFSGALLVEGSAIINGDINRDSGDRSVLLAAGDDISIKDFKAPLLFGGDLVIFSGGDVQIVSTERSEFDIRGAIFAAGLSLEKCSLYHVPSVVTEFRDLLPGYEVIIREWISP